MANAKVWKNVAVAMQSAIGAALTISAITKAATGVVTSTAHGLTNGDIVWLQIQGMYQLNNKAVRVANVTANTFELEGVDTTLFDTFSTGTAAKVTLGTSITTATQITADGGDFDFIDTTTIHDAQRSQIPGLPNASKLTMENIWDISDAGLKAMKAASDNQAQRVFCLTFGTGGQKMYVGGYVGASLMPTGQAQQLVTTPAVITINGTPTYY